MINHKNQSEKRVKENSINESFESTEQWTKLLQMISIKNITNKKNRETNHKLT